MTTFPRAPVWILTSALLMASSRQAAAQGALSTQGLGFPPGQLGTQARTMGGSLGEVDPVSPLNPASIALLGSPILVMQMEPEFRDVRFGNQSVKSSVSRFPLFVGAMTLGSRFAVGLSASTLLDRSWETVTRDSQVVNGDTIRSTITNRSLGSISDVRLAFSFSMNRWLKVGLAGHALSGNDVVSLVRAFDDTVRFATDAQRTTISFGGSALSGGAVGIWPRIAAVGVSYRRGGTMRAYSGDSTVGQGSAPGHLGVSLVYLGIRGTALAVRAAKDDWSQMEGIARTLNIHEGWDIGVGADVTGPRFGSNAIALRAGGRWRTLPFSLDSEPVKEQTWSGGFALPLGFQRSVELSVGVLRSSRTSAIVTTGAGDVSEKAWTFSTGFSVRP